MYQTILATTDGSERAREAVERGIELAALFNATLHLLYVVDTGQFAANVPEEAREELFEELTAEGESVLSALEAQATDAGVGFVDPALRRGIAHEEILAHAEAESIELVVMGSYGEGGFDAGSLGHTAAAVAGKLDGPLLLI